MPLLQTKCYKIDSTRCFSTQGTGRSHSTTSWFSSPISNEFNTTFQNFITKKGSTRDCTSNFNSRLNMRSMPCTILPTNNRTRSCTPKTRAWCNQLVERKLCKIRNNHKEINKCVTLKYAFVFSRILLRLLNSYRSNDIFF